MYYYHPPFFGAHAQRECSIAAARARLVPVDDLRRPNQSARRSDAPTARA